MAEGLDLGCPANICQRVDMEAFLRKSKKVDWKAVEEVHVVLGNEACDLDSAACAIAYAFHLHQLYEKKPQSLRSLHAFVPMLNIARADYPLRTDIRHVLSRHSLAPDLLTFRDDLDLASARRSGRLRLVLVDWNSLPAADTPLEEAVVEVIDHRVRTRSEADDNAGAILADTVCLAAAAGRTTPKDARVVAQLEALGEAAGGCHASRQQAFDEINRIKQDVAGLCTADLLRKDLKFVEGASGTPAVAFCAVMEDMKVFFLRRNAVRDIDRFYSDRHVLAVILMFMHVDDTNTPSRELAIYSTDEAQRKRLCGVLEGASNPSLSLRRVAHDDVNIAAYIQGNVKATRKIVLPLISSSVK